MSLHGRFLKFKRSKFEFFETVGNILEKKAKKLLLNVLSISFKENLHARSKKSWILIKREKCSTDYIKISSLKFF